MKARHTGLHLNVFLDLKQNNLRLTDTSSPGLKFRLAAAAATPASRCGQLSWPIHNNRNYSYV